MTSYGPQIPSLFRADSALGNADLESGMGQPRVLFKATANATVDGVNDAGEEEHKRSDIRTGTHAQHGEENCGGSAVPAAGFGKKGHVSFVHSVRNENTFH